ncbi:hypothetical protein HYV81_02540 [Candidatus Woesearchaeota archaeon]|nr:hypothetical protein [Candidatus Woesearchaeota archaeon]
MKVYAAILAGLLSAGCSGIPTDIPGASLRAASKGSILHSIRDEVNQYFSQSAQECLNEVVDMELHFSWFFEKPPHGAIYALHPNGLKIVGISEDNLKPDRAIELAFHERLHHLVRCKNILNRQAFMEMYEGMDPRYSIKNKVEDFLQKPPYSETTDKKEERFVLLVQLWAWQSYALPPGMEDYLAKFINMEMVRERQERLAARQIQLINNSMRLP